MIAAGYTWQPPAASGAGSSVSRFSRAGGRAGGRDCSARLAFLNCTPVANCIASQPPNPANPTDRQQSGRDKFRCSIVRQYGDKKASSDGDADGADATDGSSGEGLAAAAAGSSKSDGGAAAERDGGEGAAVAVGADRRAALA
jgi:hypothetical protein